MADFRKHIPEALKGLLSYQAGLTESEIKRRYGLKKIIKLASNENPFGPSPKVLQFLQENLHLVGRYPEDAAPELKQALAEYTQSSAQQIVFANGASELIQNICRLFLKPETNLIISEHTFALYKIVARKLGADVKLIPENNFHADLDAMLNAIDQQTRLIIVANPDNPTGTWIDAETLFSFIKKIPEDIVVVVDEAYFEYMQQKDYKSAVELIAQHANLIVVRSFSKAYGLTGLRFGYAITSEVMANLLKGLRLPFNVNNLALNAALTALGDQEHLAKTIASNQQEMKMLKAYFDKHNLPVISDAGNFVTVEFGEQTTNIAEQLLQQGIIVRTLEPYNMPHHIRITIGTPEENAQLIQALDRLL